MSRGADAVAWCAAGRARSFAIPSKLRHMDSAGVDRTLARIAAGERYPRLRIHVCFVGEGAGTPHVYALDDAGRVGEIGAHHARWIAALPRHAVAALSAVVLRPTGGHYGPRSRGLNVALVGIGAALRLATALPTPALTAIGSAAMREPPVGYDARRRARAGQAPRRRVTLGHVVATPGALALGVPLLPLLARHATGDWGDVCDADAQANRVALAAGDRLFSVYHTPAGTLWIVTEASRSTTTLLLPEDY